MTERDVTSLFMPLHPDGRPEWTGKQAQGPHPAPAHHYEVEPESGGYAVVRHSDDGQRHTIHLADTAEQARAWLAAFRRKAGEQS